MTKNFLTFLFILFSIGVGEPSHAQDSRREQERLPQIQLEDYTIVGLEKVVLPQKERRVLFKKIGLNWSENTSVQIKASPNLSFRSPNKPGFLLSSGSPYVDALIEYGSFNTSRVRVDAKYSEGNVVPFAGVDFSNSDGHVGNAEYTRISLSGGIEGRLWENSAFQLTGGYNRGKQSLWSSAIPTDSSMEKKSTTWNWQARLDQKLSEQFSIFATGQFQTFDLENRFKYAQNWLVVDAGAIFSSSNSSILIEGELARNETDRDVEPNNPFAAEFSWGTEYSLYSSKLKGAQKFGNLALSAGIKSQHLKADGGANSKTYIYPIAEVSLNVQNRTQFSVGYHPGLEFQSMSQMLQAHEIADFGSFQPPKSKHKIEGIFSLGATLDLRFDILSNYSEFENIPVVYASDTSVTGVSTLNYIYPYWEYRYINDAKVWENSFRAVLTLPEQLLVEGWLTYRWNEIAASDESDNAISGNEIPYLPVLSALAKIEWHFRGNHRLQITGEYAGERFNEVANSTRLKDYFLIGAQINFSVSRQVSVRFFGNNLLDQSYKLFHTYSAPGISGGGGIEIKL